MATACAAGAGFLLLTAMVATGACGAVDVAVREAFRPDDVWGPAQQMTGPLIDRLQPGRAFGLLALVSAGVSVMRRSWRPAAAAALAVGAASAATLVTKHAIGRADPHLDVYSGGSYPSGHMVADLVSAGCVLLLLVQRTRWWMWLLFVLPVGAVMAVAMLFAAAHWFSDVIGGALLAAVVLALLSGSPLRHGSSPGDPTERGQPTGDAPRVEDRYSSIAARMWWFQRTAPSPTATRTPQLDPIAPL